MVSPEVINKIITDTIINMCYISHKYTTSEGKTISLSVREVVKPSTFLKHLHNARLTNPPNDRWRVLEPSSEYAAEKYKNAKLYVSRHGSTIAVDSDGTIISVCSYKDNNGKSYDNAAALMSFAVSIGGDKLDTFDGNYTFYRHCGFEPSTWIRFDDFDTSVIPEWVSGYESNPSLFQKEDIIFFKYTGEKSKYLTTNDFKQSQSPVTSNKPSDDIYQIASDLRNNS